MGGINGKGLCNGVYLFCRFFKLEGEKSLHEQTATFFFLPYEIIIRHRCDNLPHLLLLDISRERLFKFVLREMTNCRMALRPFHSASEWR